MVASQLDDQEVGVLAGIDTHKHTLAVAVIDRTGRPVVVTEVGTTESGLDALEELLAHHQVTRVGIKGRARGRIASEPTDAEDRSSKRRGNSDGSTRVDSVELLEPYRNSGGGRHCPGMIFGHAAPATPAPRQRPDAVD